MNFDRYIAHWARYRRDEPFMTCEGDELSWGELDAAAGALAHHLSQISVGPGDRFGCLIGNCLEWCVGFAAAIRIGAIMTPLNAMFGRFELGQMAADADCSAILSTPALIAKLGIVDDAVAGALRVYDLRGGRPPMPYEDILGSGKAAPRNDRGDEDVLAICYTSGTTGIPKGVMLTHKAVETMVQRVDLNFGWTAGEERMLILAPLAFTGGIISNLAVQLVIGASSWLEKSVDPKRALDLIIRHRITYLGGVPALWERVAAAPGFNESDISSLRNGSTGGAPVPVELLRRFIAKGVLIRQQYGVSENCGTVTFPDAATAAERPHSSGPPLLGVDVRVCDNEGRVLADGDVGEIRVRGDQLMRGYWNKPAETAAAFDGDWYKTGDLGHFDEHGSIVVVDRKKNMLISGGVNIYPAEIERGIMQIPGVVEVAVVGVPDATWGQAVCAIVHAPSLCDPANIITQARDLLGPMKAPKRVVFSGEPLPKTVSNKIARIGLIELFNQLAESAGFMAN